MPITRCGQPRGSDSNPCTAAFGPPPAEHGEHLLRDLVAHLSGDEHPALLQEAIAHVQFETIHPFADGNGRNGRAFIQLVLRRRRAAARSVRRESGNARTSQPSVRAVGIIEAFNGFERVLASPDSDSRLSPVASGWAGARASLDAERKHRQGLGLTLREPQRESAARWPCLTWWWGMGQWITSGEVSQFPSALG